MTNDAVGIVVSNPDHAKMVAKICRPILPDQPISETLRRVTEREPIFKAELWGNDHEEIASILRKLCSELSTKGIPFKVYEFHDRGMGGIFGQEPFDEIGSDVLLNILAEHDRRRAEM